MPLTQRSRIEDEIHQYLDMTGDKSKVELASTFGKSEQWVTTQLDKLKKEGRVYSYRRDPHSVKRVYGVTTKSEESVIYNGQKKEVEPVQEVEDDKEVHSNFIISKTSGQNHITQEEADSVIDPLGVTLMGKVRKNTGYLFVEIPGATRGKSAMRLAAETYVGEGLDGFRLRFHSSNRFDLSPTNIRISAGDGRFVSLEAFQNGTEEVEPEETKPTEKRSEGPTKLTPLQQKYCKEHGVDFVTLRDALDWKWGNPTPPKLVPPKKEESARTFKKTYFREEIKEEALKVIKNKGVSITPDEIRLELGLEKSRTFTSAMTELRKEGLYTGVAKGGRIGGRWEVSKPETECKEVEPTASKPNPIPPEVRAVLVPVFPPIKEKPAPPKKLSLLQRIAKSIFGD